MAALIDRARYEAILGITVPLADQARVDLLLEVVSDAIRDECGWHIAPILIDDELVADGSGALIQNLPTLKLNEVTAVTEDGTTLSVDDPPASGTVHWSDRGQLSKGNWGSCARWTWKPRGVVAIVDHGYAECPAAVSMVVCSAVQSLMRPVPVGVRSESKGPFSVVYLQPSDGKPPTIGLSAADIAVLARYALPPNQRAGV